ncbi:peptide chain release factor N(5)-glutamine methyltransferase [Candidatus Gracilibacteria bacterium]|nr:peptide chain release factor N(5)-glutamine methyltransferase [Candidatus Gracilibacteria bacterium]
MTIKALLEEGVDFLDARDNALLDCEVILAYVLGFDREHLIAHFDDAVDADLQQLFKNYMERIEDGEPIAYITGSKEFYGLDFFVDSRVLVPRPETEHLVERILSYMRKNDGKRYDILDVGTGSCNIPVAIVAALREKGEDLIGIFDAVDVSDDALHVAQINVAQHGLEDKIHVYQSDLMADVGDSYDIIVANLPYIGEESNRFVSADVEKHEPNVALFGGSNGLELYEKMFLQLIEKDIDYKLIVGEFGFAQSEIMGKLLDKYFEGKWVIDKDYADIDRIFVIIK